MIPILEVALGDDDAPWLARECGRRVGLSREQYEALEALVADHASDDGTERVTFGLEAGAFVMCIDGAPEVRHEVDDSAFDAKGLTELRLELVASHSRAALGELKRQNAELLDALAEKELAEELHRVSKRRLELAAEAAGLGTWEVDGDVKLSRIAAELLGLPSRRLPLRELADSLEEGGRRLVDAVRELEEHDEVELDVATEDRWLQLRGAKIGNPPRVVGTVVDVTERKEREREARFRLELERQLVGIVSHDLKSPLAAIAMGVGMLEDADPFVVKRLRSSVRRAQQLIYDLLDFTRARLGEGIPIVRRPSDLCSVVNECVEQARLAHGDRAILCEAETARAEVDPERVAQVVTNLLANAIEYGDPAKPIRVSSGIRDRWAVISVHNHGEPIPAERLDSIFEPLERAQPGERGSLGLGLFIVEHIVRAHGGEIDVQSSSAGTVFTVRFPAS